MPAQAAIFHHDMIVTAREGDSNPPRLGRGDTRGSTEARDHFFAPVAEKTTGIRLLNGTTQVQFLPGAPFPDDVKVAWPPVKRLVVVRVHVGEPFQNGARPVGRGRCLENSRTFKRCPRFDSLALR